MTSSGIEMGALCVNVCSAVAIRGVGHGVGEE